MVVPSESGLGIFSKIETALEVFKAAVRKQNTLFIFKLIIQTNTWRTAANKPVKLDKA